MTERTVPETDLTGEIPQRCDSRQDWDRRWANVTFLVVTALVCLPSLIARTLWSENGRSTNDFVVFILLPIIQFYLVLLCPVMLIRAKPRLAAFDCQWFRWDRSELKRFLLLALGIYLIEVAPSPLIYFFSVPFRAPGIILHNNIRGIEFWAVIAIYGVVLAPITEEVFWRGYAQSTLTRSFGPSIAILGQAALFGLMHIGPPLRVAETFLMGLLFGIWRHKRRTLLPLILLHMALNAPHQANRWLHLEEKLRPVATARDDVTPFAEASADTPCQFSLTVSDTAEPIQQLPSLAAATESNPRPKHVQESRIHAEPLSLADIPFCFKDCRFDPASSLNGTGTCRRQLPRSPPASSGG